MAEDKREAILTQIKAILDQAMGDGKSFRNKIEVPENARPASVLLDADETKEDAKDTALRGRPPEGAMIVMMSPEIFILCAGASEEVGQLLNAERVKIVKAILTDATLQGLCHNKEIRYEGFTTAMATGRSMEGQARLHFTIPYVLRPNKL